MDPTILSLRHKTQQRTCKWYAGGISISVWMPALMETDSILACFALLAIREVASAASTDKVVSPMGEAVVDFLAFLLEGNFVPAQVEVVIW